ncbi:hypothetical protein AX17_001097 [Amanita inopinata Kibby_2008]|nr:hypothetical protein AX17_001097 [Amanita inopinata Kibby_2008]
MPHFNIFKAFASAGRGHNSTHPPESRTDTSWPASQDFSAEREQTPGQLGHQLPSTKRGKTLTKRRHVKPNSQPRYSVRREDIGHYDLGRYPTAPPGPTDVGLNPTHYGDAVPLEGTRIEYPTLTNDSFHPMGQSSRRWSPIPDVYREPVTKEYDDTGLITGPSQSFHNLSEISESPIGETGGIQHGEVRGPRIQQPKDGTDLGDENQNRAFGRVLGNRYLHEIPQSHKLMHDDARVGDVQGIRYVQDSTINGVPYQNLSESATPINLTDWSPSGHEKGRHSDVIEPMIFEHEVFGDDRDPNPKIWHYIVPGGLDVLFKDEDGNELTRIRNTGKRSNQRRVTPMVIEDEFGNVVYRTGDFDSLSSSSHTRSESSRQQIEYPYASRYQKSKQTGGSEPVVRAPVWVERRSGSPTKHMYTSYLSPEAEKVILIDERGRQIPIADRRRGTSTKHYRRGESGG